MTKFITWGRHPNHANGQWIKLFKGSNANDTATRKAQGFELRLMPFRLHPEKDADFPALTEENRKEAFLRSVMNMEGAKMRWQERAKTGLTDSELEKALRYELGTAGGSGGSDILNISYQGSGLKIWAGWRYILTSYDVPIFEGKSTIAMARKTFNIANPNDKQISLF